MKTPSLTPWFNLYLGESKYNIEIKASRLCVLYYGWGWIGLSFLCGLGFSPLRYYGFIALFALFLGLAFYQWVSADPSFFFKYFTSSLSQVCSLCLSAPLNTSSLETPKPINFKEVGGKSMNNLCYANILPRAPCVELSPAPWIGGVISAQSRVSSLGVWLVVELSDKTQVELSQTNIGVDGKAKKAKAKSGKCYLWLSFLTAFLTGLKRFSKAKNRKTFFFFNDNMSRLDFKRVCRLIQYAKYSANSGNT